MIVEGVLTGKHILVTAPYNLQVNRLQRRLGNRARVGTVDKFQGQEAPVAIHSLTASDGDSAPRGLDFLLAANRVNVAISRAQCLSIVVGSPQLATGISSSISNVEQLSRLCWLMQGSQGMADASRIDRPH
jgi:superfamily I DNA and/or RNA helicase